MCLRNHLISLFLSNCFVAFTFGLEDAQNSFLDVAAILDGWESSYGSIYTCHVSYSSTPRTMNLGENDQRRQTKVVPVRVRKTEDIRTGKYICDLEVFHMGPDKAPTQFKHCFNGTFSKNYVAGNKLGGVRKGLVGWDVETNNRLLHYMLLNRYSYEEEFSEFPDGIPRLSYILRKYLSRAKVGEELEYVAGHSCHVIEVSFPELEAGWKIWIAHDLGFLPLRFVDFCKKQSWREEIVVEKAGFYHSDTNKMWYPLKAYRIVETQDAKPIKYVLETEEFIPNIPVDEATFDFDFPIGTKVTDSGF